MENDNIGALLVTLIINTHFGVVFNILFVSKKYILLSFGWAIN
jgi:hypothetical protein